MEDNPNPKGIAVTKDEIIEMAKSINEDWWLDDIDLQNFAKLVALRYQKKIADLENIICQRHWDVLQEREACAKIADEWAVGWPHPSQSIAEWIRKRT